MRRTALKDMTDLALLAAEAQSVIGLRLMRIAAGGALARRETRRMLSEKVTAGAQAYAQLLSGKSPRMVVKGYRKKVKANLRRLSK